MLYFITIVNDQEIERPWHVDEPVVQFRLEDLDEVYADGHELLYILNNVDDVTRPNVDARSHTWTDKEARHIHSVLTKKFGRNTQGYLTLADFETNMR